MDNVPGVPIHRSNRFIQAVSVKKSGNKKLAVVIRITSTLCPKDMHTAV